MKKVLTVLLRGILIILGSSLIGQTIWLLSIVNFNTGIVATIGLGTVYVLYGVYWDRIKRWLKTRLRKVLFYTAHALHIVMIAILIFISIVGKWDTVTHREDALIVLGAGLQGELITYPLYYRLREAVYYHRSNPDALIVVTGGQGFGETVTEASAMEKFLLGSGVPANKIVKEERATSTYENFVYSKAILDRTLPHGYTTAFVTNNFHVFRANELAKLAGLPSTHLHATLQWYIIPVSYIRESLAIVKLVLLRQ
jgi:uncharacterized SAM-binding protein YcdF (DUF218 family)